MGTKRALIISLDRDSFLPIEDFLKSKGLITTVVSNYKDGFERLFNEKPDLVIISELTSYKLSPALIKRIDSSGYFEVVNIKEGKVRGNLKPVIIIEEAERLNALIDFLKLYLDAGQSKSPPAPVEVETEETGDLKAISYPNLLVSLYRDKRTGVLTIISGVRFKIYFTDGVPVFAEEGDVETALGRMLLDSGRISKADYKGVVDIAVKKRLRFGDALVEMGVVSPHELNSFLELQVREKIIRGFNYTQGKYSFKPKSNFLGRTIGYQINLLQVLYEGIKRFVDIGDIEEIFFIKQEGNPTVELSPNLREEINSIKFGPRESRFIQLLKDKESINDIVKTSRLDMGETLKLLYFLHLLGLLKISETKLDTVEKPAEKMSEKPGLIRKEEIKLPRENAITPEEKVKETELEPSQGGVDKVSISEEFKNSHNNKETKVDKERRKKEKEEVIDEILKTHPILNEKNHYEVLGVGKNSKKEEIRSAYFNLAKKFHPDAHPDFEKGIKEKAEEIFTRITIAYQTLSDSEKRAEYDSQIEAIKLTTEAKASCEAEIAYKKGEVFLKQRRYMEAQQEFKNAVSLSPDEATYIGTLAWATFAGTMDKDRVLHDVKKQLERAISLNPKLPQTYYYLGCVHKYAESEKQAEENFLKALEYDPEYLEAKRELRLIQMRRSEKGDNKGKNKKDKGFWPSLFNK
jgi:curved DNA-binding protein CbpA